MLYLSTAEEIKDSELLELGVDTYFASAEALRDHLIELISVRNLRHRPEALFALFGQVLAETLFAEDLPLLGPGTPTTHPSPGSLGGCYSDLMDLPLYSCYRICKWSTVWATSHNCLLLYVTWPYPPCADTPGAICRSCCFQTRVWSIRWMCTISNTKRHIDCINSISNWAWEKAWQCWCITGFKGDPMRTNFSRLSSSHMRSAATRGKNTENRLWKRVVPSETEFAWLPPDIAWAFCSDALRRRSDCQYLAFHEAHMGLHGRAFQANIFIADMVFLGDTRSAEELAVFTNMAPERLCLGCGLRVAEKFTPIFPGERGPLFAAAVKLLQFALRVASASAFAKELTDEEDAPTPLVVNPDCHFLAVLTVLVQSILEGRTVFGAGKTRAAAGMIAGLLVMDPTLKVMVVTKENAAAHAFAKHIESLQLPPSLEEKFGRLVGATELEKAQPAKQSLISCQATVTQSYAPSRSSLVAAVVSTRNVRNRIAQLHVGWQMLMLPSMTRASSMETWMRPQPLREFPARALLFGVVITNKRQADCARAREARVFRRKLMRRPIALRGDTTFLPPHMLGAIVHPYVKDVPGPQMAGLSQLLEECTKQPLGLSTGSVKVFQDLCKETIGGCWVAGITSCCCAAIAVLWLALAPERFPLQADTFRCAAGTAGKQKWSLILPSSARVSELTYNTIIGTRYPELDNVQNDIIQFGNYLQAEQCTRGGFLPIFWDAPYSYIQACTDIGEVVDWVIWRSSTTETKWSIPLPTQSGCQVQVVPSSRAVLRPVLVWQPSWYYLLRPGWVSSVEGEGKNYYQLPAQEQASQKEEAYARATVALTRAQQICFIMGPLDHARTRWSCDHHRLLEIWGQFQWAWWTGGPCLPHLSQGWRPIGVAWWLGLPAKPAVFMCKS